jgi:hypothetical protein
MRWEALFEDLEADVERIATAELAAEVADRTRRELARIRLVDRLREATGRTVTVAVAGHGPVAGVLADAGPDWLLLTADGGREVLLPLSAVLAVTSLGAAAVDPASEGKVARAFQLGHVLRAVVRDRATVHCGLVDGSFYVGTLDRVGADHVDVAEHAPDEPRRPAAVRTVRTVPLSALAIIRRL